jgi:hypothetical protein
MKNICGIDPGLTGGIVCLSSDGEVVLKTPMPMLGDELDLQAVKSLLLDLGSRVSVAIEKASTRPGQSAQSGFTTGRNYGALIGVIASVGLPYEEVTPQKWTKALEPAPTVAGMSQYQRKRAIKLRNKKAAMRLYPAVDLRGSERSREAHEGIVDALLIAHWALQNA